MGLRVQADVAGRSRGAMTSSCQRMCGLVVHTNTDPRAFRNVSTLGPGSKNVQIRGPNTPCSCVRKADPTNNLPVSGSSRFRLDGP